MFDHDFTFCANGGCRETDCPRHSEHIPAGTVVSVAWFNCFPEPGRPVGEWKINPDGYYPYCSICNEEPRERRMTKYCSNCGAIMKIKPR